METAPLAVWYGVLILLALIVLAESLLGERPSGPASRSSVTTRNRLDSYLAAFSTRLEQLALVRGLAALCVVALVVSAAGALLGVRTGFADGVIYTARGLLACWAPPRYWYGWPWPGDALPETRRAKWRPGPQLLPAGWKPILA